MAIKRPENVKSYVTLLKHYTDRQNILVITVSIDLGVGFIASLNTNSFTALRDVG